MSHQNIHPGKLIKNRKPSTFPRQKISIPPPSHLLREVPLNAKAIATSAIYTTKSGRPSSTRRRLVFTCRPVYQKSSKFCWRRKSAPCFRLPPLYPELTGITPSFWRNPPVPRLYRNQPTPKWFLYSCWQFLPPS